MQTQSDAAKCIELMQARDFTIALAYNQYMKNIRPGWRSTPDLVDGIYKFYNFLDGSQIGVRIREHEHEPQWPKEKQQVWISKGL